LQVSTLQDPYEIYIHHQPTTLLKDENPESILNTVKAAFLVMRSMHRSSQAAASDPQKTPQH
jgi:hypothetical protein